MGQRVREGEIRGDFVARQTFVRHAQRLIVNVTVKIALTLQQLDHIVVARVGQWCCAMMISALSPQRTIARLIYFDRGSGSRIFAPRSE